MTISEHIRRHRDEHHLSSRALAQKLQMSYAHLNSIENGRKKAGPAVKRRIAEAIGIAVEQLDNPSRRVVQIALAAFPSQKDILGNDIQSFMVGKLWSDGSVTCVYWGAPVAGQEVPV